MNRYPADFPIAEIQHVVSAQAAIDWRLLLNWAIQQLLEWLVNRAS